MSSRMKRVEALMLQSIPTIIKQKINDERIGFISFTGVEIAKDLSVAKVYYSQIGSDEEKERTFKGLCSAAGAIKGYLSNIVQLKRIPNLRFFYDDSLERGAETLRKINELGIDNDA